MDLSKSLFALLWRKFLLAVMLTTIFVGPVQSLYASTDGKEGVKDGGGGNVLLFAGQSKPVLLDLVMLNLDLKSNSNNPRAPEIKKKYKEFESINENDKIAIQMAQQKVSSWLNLMTTREQEISKQFLTMLKYAIAHVYYVRTAHQFKTQNQYYLPDDYKSLNPEVKTAILFMFDGGAAISSPIWDRLDAETQVGLIIHEGMRQLQVQYQNVFSDIDNMRLQLLTAILLKRTPSHNFKFDEWMSSSMSEYFTKLGAASQLEIGYGDPPITLSDSDQRLVQLQKIISADFLPEFNRLMFDSDSTQNSLNKFLSMMIKEKIRSQSEK